MLKYKICVFLVLLLCLSSFYYVEGKERALPLFGKVLYIDPGHPSLYKPNVISMSCSK